MDLLISEYPFIFKIAAVIWLLFAILLFNRWNERYPVETGNDLIGIGTYVNLYKRWGIWKTAVIYSSVVFAGLLYLLPTVATN